MFVGCKILIVGVVAVATSLAEAIQEKGISANVQISQMRSGGRETAKVTVRMGDEEVFLDLQETDQIWMRGARVFKLANSKFGTIVTEEAALSEEKTYTNRETGSVLRITETSVEGLLDPMRAIKFDSEEDVHRVYNLELNQEEDNNDALMPPFNITDIDAAFDSLPEGPQDPSDEGDALTPPFNITDIDAAFESSSSDSVVQTRQDPSGAYTIEVLVVVDYALAAKFNFDHKTIHNYLTVFWNGVQARFTSINRTPPIQIKLIGAVIIESESEQPFMIPYGNYIDALKTINAFGIWLEATPNIPKHDFAYLQTARDMAASGNAGVSGIAWVGTICLTYGVKSYASGFGEDGKNNVPTYDGVHIAAHELGHNLGSPHDPKVAGDCNWAYGYVMSYLTKGPTKVKFSSCSVESFYKTARTRSCLSVTNYEVKPACIGKSKKVPGEIQSADDYCKAIFRNPGAKVFIDNRGYICFRMSCRLSNGAIRYYFRPGPVGTPCNLAGKDGKCSNGVCDTTL